MKTGSGKQLHITHKDLYRVWSSFKHRCDCPTSQAYKDYGGRGIVYAEEWSSFENFLHWALCNGYEKGLELDRRDNNKGYSPENCRFVSVRCNSRNRRNNSKLGSCIYQQSKGFLVRVYNKGKLHNLGTHESIELAELVRDEFENLYGLGGCSH